MTFSIVARDKTTGELGVAVQSHWFSVGSVVPWARAGVGAVATQSNSELSYGPLGLELMGAGKSAKQALDALLRADPMRETRQVAMVDANGIVAAHTGSKCGPYAGDTQGDGFSCQANLMRNKTIWSAMKRRYLSAPKTEGKNAAMRGASTFAERLVETLVAAEEAGGDIRGKQSAAILVVSGEKSGAYWQGRQVDLRVEDNPEPIPELSRVLRLHRGYEWANKADGFLATRDFASSSRAYCRAFEYAPEIEELQFWQAVSLSEAGKHSQAEPLFRTVFQKNPDWKELARILPSLKKLRRKDKFLREAIS